MADVLKVKFTAVGDANEHIVCAAPSGDTVTILSITICERAGAETVLVAQIHIFMTRNLCQQLLHLSIPQR